MEAVVGTLKFLGLNGLTAVAALAIASRCRLGSRAERFLATCVLYVGIALASGLALGLTGHLRFWWVLALQAAIAAPAAVMARWDLVTAMLDPRGLLTIFGNRWLRIAAAVVGIAYTYVGFLGLVGEPFTGDALMYHLPLTAAFAHEGRIVVPQLGKYWHTDWWAYHPANAYVLYQWWVLPFGSGVLVDLVQLPYAFAAALATFVLSREVGARRDGAAWAGLLLLTVPIVLNQSKTTLVDVTLTFLFSAGLAFAVANPPSTGRWLLAAVAWGALPGAKLSGMIYLGVGVGCVVFHMASLVGMRTLLRRAVPAALVLGVAVLLLSSYWFLRNYWIKGSPIFPLTVLDAQKFAWTNIFAYGPLIPLLDFTVYEPVFFYNYETGAGVQFVALALPAAAVLLIRRLREHRLGHAAIAAAALGMYPFWLVSHSREPHTLFRFVLPAMPLGFAAAGWLISHARRAPVVVGLAAFSVVFSTVNALPHVGSFLLPDSIRSGIARLMLGVHQYGRFDRMGDLATQDYRRAWHYLDQLPGTHDIAATHLIFTYPMLGADFRHRVHFLAADTRHQWMGDLRAAGIDRVAVAQLGDPNGRIVARNGTLELTLNEHVTGDEYVAAMRSVPVQSIAGLRIRYEVPSSTNARVVVGVNRFDETFELPLDAPHTAREETVAWHGDVSGVEVLLGFVPRTQLRDEIAVRVSSLALLRGDGTAVPVPLVDNGWARASWPLEYYWMESDPEHFRLAFQDTDYWAGPSGRRLRIYEVIGGGRS